MQAIAEQHDDYTLEKVHVPPSNDCRTVERLYIDKCLPAKGRITTDAMSKYTVNSPPHLLYRMLTRLVASD